MEFREGDLVVGKHDAPYAITRPGVICRVRYICAGDDPQYMQVETGPHLDPELEPEERGSFMVKAEFFMLYDGNKNRDAFDAAIQSPLLGGGA